MAKEFSIKKIRVNALAPRAIEIITKKPSFRNVVNQGCLVIANGFYEWQWHDSNEKTNQSFKLVLRMKNCLPLWVCIQHGTTLQMVKKKKHLCDCDYRS